MQRSISRPAQPRAKRPAWFSGALLVVGITAAVEVLARLGVLTEYVPPPSVVAGALASGLTSGQISGQVGVTILSAVSGLAAATVLAVTAGVLMGAVPIVYDAFRYIVDLLRPVPAVAMIPLAILFLGIGTQMRIVMITYAAFWPLLISTLYGVRAVDPVALDTARNFGVPFGQTLWRVVLPSALSNVSTGLRVSASIALVVCVSTELVAGDSGIGYFVSQMEQANRLPQMYAGILLTGILGYLVNATFFELERRVVFWAPQSRDVAL